METHEIVIRLQGPEDLDDEPESEPQLRSQATWWEFWPCGLQALILFVLIAGVMGISQKLDAILQAIKAGK